jgi:hypothetical protein
MKRRALLSIWIGFNLLLAAGILFSMVALRRNAPSLSMVFSEVEIARLDRKALALVNTLALLLNACVVALCGLALRLLFDEKPPRFRLLASLGFVQLFGFLCDAYLGHRNLVANLASTGVLAAGFFSL